MMNSLPSISTGRRLAEDAEVIPSFGSGETGDAESTLDRARGSDDFLPLIGFGWDEAEEEDRGRGSWTLSLFLASEGCGAEEAVEDGGLVGRSSGSTSLGVRTMTRRAP